MKNWLKRAGATVGVLASIVVSGVATPVADARQVEPAHQVKVQIVEDARAYLSFHQTDPDTDSSTDEDGPTGPSGGGWYGRAPPVVGPAQPLSAGDSSVEAPSFKEAITTVIESGASPLSAVDSVRKGLEEPVSTKSESAAAGPPLDDVDDDSGSDERTDPDVSGRSDWRLSETSPSGDAPSAPATQPAGLNSDGPDEASGFVQTGSAYILDGNSAVGGGRASEKAHTPETQPNDSSATSESEPTERPPETLESEAEAPQRFDYQSPAGSVGNDARERGPKSEEPYADADADADADLNEF